MDITDSNHKAIIEPKKNVNKKESSKALDELQCELGAVGVCKIPSNEKLIICLTCPLA